MECNSELYRAAVTRLNPKVTDEEWDYFQSGFTTKTFKPQDFFIEAGKKNHQPGFVTSGLIRGFYTNDLGEDITIMFVNESE